MALSIYAVIATIVNIANIKDVSKLIYDN